MKLEHSFEVAAPVQRVWEALIDVEYVAPCLPGAAVTGRDEDGSYRGTFTVKLGPTTAAYNGVLRIGDVDEAAHRATLHARGTDKRGQGGATATIVNTLTEAGPGATRVQAETDFAITGRLARFGRGGMIEDISNRLLQEFSSCLQQRLAAEEASDQELAAAQAGPAAAPAGGGPAAGTSPSAEAATAAQADAGAASAQADTGADGPAAPPDPGPIAPGQAAPGQAAPGQAAPGQAAPGQAAPGGPAQSAAQPPGQPPAAPSPPRPRPAAPVTPAKPVNGLAIFFSVLWRRLKARVSARRRAR